MRVSVFGITGNTGPAMIRRLLSQPPNPISHVVAVTSSTQTERFKASGIGAIEDERLQVLECDLDDPGHQASLQTAVARADAVSFCSIATKSQAEKELRVVRAAAEAGVKRVVQLGIAPQFLNDENMPSHGGLQRQVRQALRELPLRSVLIGCNYFQQSTKYYSFPVAIHNAVKMPLRGEVAARFVHVEDVARFACAALLVPDAQFDTLATVHPGCDFARPGTEAGPHWDMSIAGPEVWQFRHWAEWLNEHPAFQGVRFEKCSGEEFAQALLQAVPDPGFADNVVKNHLYMDATHHTGIMQQPTADNLFGLVKGVSPENPGALLRFRPFFDEEFIPTVLAARKILAAQDS